MRKLKELEEKIEDALELLEKSPDIREITVWDSKGNSAKVVSRFVHI